MSREFKRHSWVQRCVSAALAVTTIAAFVFGDFAYAGTPTPRLKPPAPGPQYSSRGDQARLEIITNALKKRNYTLARETAARIENPIAQALGEWLYLYANDPNLSIIEADRFLDLHPDWPAVGRIQGHVERQLDFQTPVDVVTELFDTRDPVSSRGRLHLARALFAVGDDTAATFQLRQAWVNQDFKLEDEKALLARYGARLTPADHAARVDRLLWSRKVTAARRVFSRLSPQERNRAEVRASLLVRASRASSAFDRLAKSDREDPGLMHAAVRYLRRNGEEPRAVAIARLAPTSPNVLRNPARWWDERQLLMRWALKEKRYSDAYDMAAGHGLEPGTDFSEAEFNAGWIALRFLGAPERAEAHFKALISTVSAPISLGRGYYWLGRALEDMGRELDAEIAYLNAAEYIYTYYGQLAAERIGGDALVKRFLEAQPPAPAEAALFSSRPIAAALRILSEIDNPQAFLVFAYHLDDRLETAGEYKALAELAVGENAPHIAVRAGKVSVRRNAFAPDVSYPLVYVPRTATRYTPAEVILGLSRQESEFNPRAYSRAGARGMMQLLPSTAQLTAKKEGILYSRSRLLSDPLYNMVIGSAHLSHLFERFDGSWIMTFAGYNAGPHRVDQWVDRYGDPRSRNVDPIDWVEQIPFSETRNYVQRVLENTQIYRSRLNEGPIAGLLANDLERGGGRGRAGAIEPMPRTANAFAALPERTMQYASAVTLTPPASATDAVQTSPIAAWQETAKDAQSTEEIVAKTADKTARSASVGEVKKDETLNGGIAENENETPKSATRKSKRKRTETDRQRTIKTATLPPAVRADALEPAQTSEPQKAANADQGRETVANKTTVEEPVDRLTSADDLNALQASSLGDTI
ncbi:MAG: lytic transglycosylase domain-containing protein, partial [Pseudomonadota bacterium]